MAQPVQIVDNQYNMRMVNKNKNCICIYLADWVKTTVGLLPGKKECSLNLMSSVLLLLARRIPLCWIHQFSENRKNIDSFHNKIISKCKVPYLFIILQCIITELGRTKLSNRKTGKLKMVFQTRQRKWRADFTFSLLKKFCNNEYVKSIIWFCSELYPKPINNISVVHWLTNFTSALTGSSKNLMNSW